MKLVLAIGNFGEKYLTTRHNAGFIMLDHFLLANQLILTRKHHYGIYDVYQIFGQNVIFAKPTTFVNLSGYFLHFLVHYYKVALPDILILVDELFLDVGKFKYKEKVSQTTHNGILNIVAMLKTKSLKRIKIGIGKNDFMMIKEFVLSPFNQEELVLLGQKAAEFNQLIKKFILGNGVRDLA